MAAEALGCTLRNPDLVLSKRNICPKLPKFRVFTVKCSVGGAAIESPWKVADARLVLEHGSIWRAKSFGASITQVGEVVFNTSLTDDEESRQCFLAGLVIRSLSIRLRQDGSLIGVLSTEKSKTDEELLEMSRTWDIVGADLISGFSCKAPMSGLIKQIQSGTSTPMKNMEKLSVSV